MKTVKEDKMAGIKITETEDFGFYFVNTNTHETIRCSEETAHEKFETAQATFHDAYFIATQYLESSSELNVDLLSDRMYQHVYEMLGDSPSQYVVEGACVAFSDWVKYGVGDLLSFPALK